MSTISLLVGLLGLALLLRAVATRLRITYPILLLLFGLGLAWVPGLPPVRLSPDTVFFVFLPPLLYSAAWTINNADLARRRRAVGLLAIGLVLATAAVVAVVAHALIPGFSLAQGFLLGAIIAPTDEVAAASVMQTVGVPQRISTVVEGESLVNDASGLVIYRFALVAILTGQFNVWQAAGTFLWTTIASVALGLALGWGVSWLHRLFDRDPASSTAVSLLAPYGLYVVAEELHLSGVLAVVAAGLWVSERANNVFSSQSRLAAWSVWDTLVFLLNSLVFILMGLQLPGILAGLRGYSLGEALGYAAVLTGLVVAVRLLWMFPGAYGPRLLFAGIRRREPAPRWNEVLVVGWAGMRGIVSLAAALALPERLPNGAPFPGRDLIILLTFGVIFGTLVGQGLSLAGLIKWLRVGAAAPGRQQERRLRRRLAQAALQRLAALGNPPGLRQLQTLYEQKLTHLDHRPTADEALTGEQEFQTNLHHQLELLTAQRTVLAEQQTQDPELGSELLRRLTQELDLEAARLLSVAEVYKNK